MQEISIEKIVNLVVKEVVQELVKQGVKVVSTGGSTVPANLPISSVDTGLRTKSEKIDMSKYKSAVLTENHVDRLHVLTGEIVIPKGTIITPKAKQKIREKQIAITFE